MLHVPRLRTETMHSMQRLGRNQHTMTEDDAAKLDRHITGYIFGKSLYCKKHCIELDAAALKSAAQNSELFIQHAINSGPQPIVFRINRNLGYIAGNIFIGTKNDKHRMAVQHCKQRAEARAAGEPIHKGTQQLPTGWTRRPDGQLQMPPRPLKPMKPPKRGPLGQAPAGYQWSNEAPTRNKGGDIRRTRSDKLPPDQKREAKTAAQQRWREKLRERSKPTDKT
jgi:hypothetical protein